MGGGNVRGELSGGENVRGGSVQGGTVLHPASHWPCVTDNSGITTYGLMAFGREMSTPPKLQLEYGTLYLFL